MQKYEIDTKNTNYKKYRCPEEEDRRLNASLSPVLSSFVPIFSASLLPHCHLTQPPLLIHQRHSMPGPRTTFRPDLSTDAVCFCTLLALTGALRGGIKKKTVFFFGKTPKIPDPPPPSQQFGGSSFF